LEDDDDEDDYEPWKPKKNKKYAKYSKPWWEEFARWQRSRGLSLE